MTLGVGTRLGAYEITGQLGAGGMGEVYRATDTKLGREVAIKTLPAAFAADEDRLARFEREAKLLASLNHTHIASVHSLDEHEGTLYLAMELVEGETLEEKLKRGALPVEEALRIALQIAEGLEAAHEKGVVHRDLKPANVMLTAEGQVKVLDFGLAKAFSGDPNRATPAHSPALSVAMTQQGLILGTAGYMSPEQASGQATDQRADIWAFGVVLYEMLTGLPLFSGESVPHVLADVLKTEPDWNRLPKHLHPRLKLLLERCLAKKPRNRYAGIADARVDIEAVLNEPDGAHAGNDAQHAATARSRAKAVVAAVVLTALGSGLAGFAAWRFSPNPSLPVTRFSIDLEGPLLAFEPVALSPDGQRIVYAANGQLYSRRMDQDGTTAIPGTELATNPFFSPDGEEVAFFTRDQLKAVGFAGQAPRVIADVPTAVGFVGSWDPSGRIIFGQAGAFGLSSVPAVGGVPQLFAPLNGYNDIDYPDMLPGGEWVLFTGNFDFSDWSGSEIVAQNVASGERKVVLEGGHFARYIETGHLVFARGARLYAVTFDPQRVEVTGSPVPVVQDLSTNEMSGHAQFAVASNGTLVFAPRDTSGGGGTQVVAVNREGGARLLTAEVRDYRRPRVAPDGSRVAIEVVDADSGSQIWVMDLKTGTAVQLTFEGTENSYPVWTPDSRDILFLSNRGERPAIYRKTADGTGGPVHVLDGSEGMLPTDVLRDNGLVYQEEGADGSLDIMQFNLETGSTAAFLATPANEFGARISPDGTWMLYVSDESGRNRVYARPYPNAGGGQRAISQGEGEAPMWSPPGDEVYFLGAVPPPLMTVSVDVTPTTITPRKPVAHFSFAGRFRLTRPVVTAPYDALTNGKEIVAVSQLPIVADGSESIASRPRVNVVQNWFEEVKRLAPTK